MEWASRVQVDVKTHWRINIVEHGYSKQLAINHLSVMQMLYMNYWSVGIVTYM